MTSEAGAALQAEQNLIPKEGFAQNLPFELYAAEPAINSGMLRDLCGGKTPAHVKARHIEKRNQKDSDAMEFGRNIHAMLLEPKRFWAKHIIMPKFTGKTKDGRESERSGEAVERKKQWLAKVPGDAIVITEEQAEDMTGMMNRLQEEEVIAGMLSAGASEVSGFWIDKATGLRCKFRVDYLNSLGKGIIDYKSTVDASDDNFIKHICKTFIHVQLYHYKMGCEALGFPVEDLIAIAQEKEYPYLPNPFKVSNYAMIEDAKARWEHYMRVLAKCQQTGHWPGYKPTLKEVVPTNYLAHLELR